MLEWAGAQSTYIDCAAFAYGAATTITYTATDSNYQTLVNETFTCSASIADGPFLSGHVVGGVVYFTQDKYERFAGVRSTATATTTAFGLYTDGKAPSTTLPQRK